MMPQDLHVEMPRQPLRLVAPAGGAQRCILALSASRRGACVDLRAQFGPTMGLIMDEDLGIDLTWLIAETQGGPVELDGARLAADLAPGGVLHGLLLRVRAGHRLAWGSGAPVGRLDADAAEADSMIAAHLSGQPYVLPAPARGWECARAALINAAMVYVAVRADSAPAAIESVERGDEDAGERHPVLHAAYRALRAAHCDMASAT